MWQLLTNYMIAADQSCDSYWLAADTNCFSVQLETKEEEVHTDDEKGIEQAGAELYQAQDKFSEFVLNYIYQIMAGNIPN